MQETLSPLSRGTVPEPASSDTLTGPDPCRRLFLFLSPIQGRSSLSLPGEDQLLERAGRNQRGHLVGHANTWTPFAVTGGPLKSRHPSMFASVFRCDLCSLFGKQFLFSP